MKFPQQWNVTKAAWQTLLRSVDAPTEYRLREALHRLGLREDAWVRTMGQIKAAIAHSSALVKEAAHAPLAHDQPILIWSVQGNLQNNVVEALLAHTLRLRGLEPRIFLCDELLPACEARNSTSYHDGTINQKANKRLCDRCFFNDRSIFNAFRLPYTLLSRYTSPEAVRRAQELVAPLSREEIFDLHYKGLHLGPIIKSSVVRFFLSLSLPEDRQTDELVHAYGASAVIMADVVDRVLDELRPFRIVTSHGLYVSWEILLEMAKLKGIPVFVFWLGKRKMTLHLNRGDNFVRALINEPASVWENVTPPADERKRVEEFLLGREAGREDRLAFYQGRDIEEREIAKELQLDPGKPTLGLFPNVLWDSEVYYRNIAFPDMPTWMWETIGFFAQHPEKQLVIRVHPGESAVPGLLLHQVQDVIAQRFPTLPANVRIIPAESKISSYGLTSFINAAAIHATQFGLELAVRGKPVIVTGGAMIRGKGFSYDVNSPQEYLAALEQFDSLPALTAEQVERAWRYGYHYYYRRQLPFRYLEPGPYITVANLHLDSLDDLRPGRNPALDFMASCIRDDLLVIYDPVSARANA